ncbi:MAG: helix-turn-helix domain-containing protein [Clostridiales Family XIII bacterium]|nr:helix-turn-helix domain-containing protein [Clostridiales Family XIII bacterium]
MKISSDMLRAELEKTTAFTVFGDVSGALSLESVMLAEKDDTFSDGHVYLTDRASEVRTPEEKVHSVILITGSYEVAFIRRFDAVFIAGDGISIVDLHNSVQRVFALYNDWSAELQHILQVGSNVQSMIDASTFVFNNPLILQDSNFSAIAVSRLYAENPSLIPIIDSNSIPYLMKSEKFASDYPGNSTSAVPLQITGRHALYVNLFQQGRFQYRLMLLEMGEAFRSSAAPLLEYLSNYIQLAIGFVIDDSAESMSLPYIMKNVLSGEYADPNFIEQKLCEVGWHKEYTYLCAKIYADIPDFKNRTLHFMCDRIRTIFAESCVFEHENCIAVIFNLNQSDYTMENVERSLIGFLQDNNLKAGISNPFSGLNYFREYFLQAAAALELGPRIKPYKWLHRFRDVAELFLIERCTERLPAHMVCAPGLLKLKAYDREHKQDLYHSLYVYLKNNLHSVNAAKELFIHRSTFLYRLERIKEIAGISLDNDTDLWYLLLSFKLLEHEGAQ